jgi:hypothetical protein
MLVASCHCGAVQLEIARRPRALTECNCSICRRCGCMTHYARVNTSNDDRIAVNARMMEPDDLAGIPLRQLDVRRPRT